jgi:hypothetical protein
MLGQFADTGDLGEQLVYWAPKVVAVLGAITSIMDMIGAPKLRAAAQAMKDKHGHGIYDKETGERNEFAFQILKVDAGIMIGLVAAVLMTWVMRFPIWIPAGVGLAAFVIAVLADLWAAGLVWIWAVATAGLVAVLLAGWNMSLPVWITVGVGLAAFVIVLYVLII